MLTKKINTDEKTNFNKTNEFKLFQYEYFNSLQTNNEISQLQQLRNSFNIWRENFLPIETFETSISSTETTTITAQTKRLKQLTGNENKELKFNSIKMQQMDYLKFQSINFPIKKNVDNYTIQSNLTNLLINNENFIKV